MAIPYQELVEWLERSNTLHTTVEMTYVVDGYIVALTYDETPVFEFHGHTLADALTKACAYEYDPETRRFERTF